MAKTSAIQKNLKRIKLVKKFANKRAALKKIIKRKTSVHIIREPSTKNRKKRIPRDKWDTRARIFSIKVAPISFP